MPRVERFPFVATSPQGGAAGLMPFVPLTLQAGSQTVTAQGLLDTGATVNVLPFAVGQSLGLAWEAQQTVVQLTGNLQRAEARAVLLSCRLGGFEPVRLAFAWTRSESVPLLLGQINFFMEFDVCFFRSQQAFELRERG